MKQEKDKWMTILSKANVKNWFDTPRPKFHPIKNHLIMSPNERLWRFRSRKPETCKCCALQMFHMKNVCISLVFISALFRPRAEPSLLSILMSLSGLKCHHGSGYELHVFCPDGWQRKHVWQRSRFIGSAVLCDQHLLACRCPRLKYSVCVCVR